MKKQRIYRKCFECGSIHYKGLLCIYDGYYCSKRCALLSMLNRQKILEEQIYKLINSLKD